MNPIEWTDALRLDWEPMDRLNRAFVERLSLAQAAPDAALAEAWSAVVEHTRQHFACEDAWMRRTRYPQAEHHALQHRMVIHVLREGMAKALAGDLQPVRDMAQELAAWFVKHNGTLDAALAGHLRGRPERPVRASVRRRASNRRSTH